MKMKIYLVIIILLVVTISAGFYCVYLYKIDTIYATRYNEVFGSYDINKVDEYLNSETQIIYKGETKTYKELRENIQSAFQEREYEMPKGSSYGHGNNKFVDGIQKIGIQSYIKSDKHYSDGLQMEIEHVGIFSVRVKSLQSDEDFFGYLFYGNK